MQLQMQEGEATMQEMQGQKSAAGQGAMQHALP